MKKLLFLGIGSALIFTMGGVGPAQADNSVTHTNNIQGANATAVIANAGAGKCASCHRAHTAKAEYLLKLAQPALCYTCHDGTGSSLAVATGVEAGTNKALRGGGFDTAMIGSGLASKVMDAAGQRTASGLIPPLNLIVATGVTDTTVAPVATTSRHNINGGAGDAGVVWGNGINNSANVSLTLECGSCHDPHGNGNYRILRPIPVDSGAGAPRLIRPARDLVPASGTVGTAGYKPEIPAVTAVMSTDKVGVKIPDAVGKVYTTANYWLSGDTTVPVDLTASYTGELTGALGGGAGVTGGTGGLAPDGYIANVANWCTTCHTRYLATTKSYKTDSGDANLMYRHRSDANYKAGAANCITCHVAHGSNAKVVGSASQVGLPGATLNSVSEVLSSPDSRLLRVDNRGTCVMCHNV